MTEAPPLAGFHIIGIRENYHQASPDAPRQAAGTCWHCGTGIGIEVVATDGQQTVTVGTTCAERVGLDADELKAHLAERFAAQRAAAAEARSAEARARFDALEAEQEAAYGPHGTEGRFRSGCLCVLCVDAAPHGTPTRFAAHGCRCLACIGAELALHPASYDVLEVTYLIDLSTGEVVEDARTVDTRYGLRRRSDSRDVWLPVEPARRSTLAKHGYTEADAVTLVRKCHPRARRAWVPEARLSTPVVDAWGEPIPRPA